MTSAEKLIANIADLPLAQQCDVMHYECRADRSLATDPATMKWVLVPGVTKEFARRSGITKKFAPRPREVTRRSNMIDFLFQRHIFWRLYFITVIVAVAAIFYFAR